MTFHHSRPMALITGFGISRKAPALPAPNEAVVRDRLRQHRSLFDRLSPETVEALRHEGASSLEAEISGSPRHVIPA